MISDLEIFRLLSVTLATAGLSDFEGRRGRLIENKIELYTRSKSSAFGGGGDCGCAVKMTTTTRDVDVIADRRELL